VLEQFKQWFFEKKSAIYEDLFTFLRFPSISVDPLHKGAIFDCVHWLDRHLHTFGFDTKLWETLGHPTLYAEQMQAGPKCPTLLFYCHYDVQPVLPLDQWRSPPFEPTIRAGKVVARGAIDNKGQCFYVLTALKAFHSLSKKLRVNVKLCIEGEEEMGSVGLRAILNDKRSELKADYLLVVDLDMPEEHQPAITLGMRGITSIEIACHNGTVDLHSGKFGGVVINPAKALIRALATLWDETGKVAVPHFYDEVQTYAQQELKDFAWDIDPKTWGHPFNVGVFGGEEGYSLLESNWIRPSVEINGFYSGYTGMGVKTVIPSKAVAKLSCRLVPNQDPDKVGVLIADFLKKKIPAGIEVNLELLEGSEGWMAPPDLPFARIVARAFEEVFHVPCRRMLCGMTIPIVPDLAKVSQSQLVMVGVALAEDGMHSPNESFALDRFEKGFLSIVRILEIISGG